MSEPDGVRGLSTIRSRLYVSPLSASNRSPEPSGKEGRLQLLRERIDDSQHCEQWSEALSGFEQLLFEMGSAGTHMNPVHNVSL